MGVIGQSETDDPLAVGLRPHVVMEYLRKNKLNVADVAYALSRRAVIQSSIKALNYGHCCAGLAYPFEVSNGNWVTLYKDVSRNIENVKDRIVVIVPFYTDTEFPLLTNLLATYLIKNGAKAIVALGKIRATNEMRRNNYPIWYEGIASSNFESVDRKYCQDEPFGTLCKQWEDVIVVCDDDGVIAIPPSSLDGRTINYLEEGKTSKERCYRELEEGRSIANICGLM